MDQEAFEKRQRVADKKRQTLIAKLAKRLTRAWNQETETWGKNGGTTRPITESLARDGLVNAIDEHGEDVEKLVADIIRCIPLASEAGIQVGDSLWGWHARRTGQWLGTREDVRFEGFKP